MKANSANLQALVEERMPRPPEVVQPAAQPRQGEARSDHGSPRKWQGAHYRDPYWQKQDGPPWQQRRARDPRPMKLDFPRFKGADPIAWVYRALKYFHYYQTLEPEKVMHASYHLDEEALSVVPRL
uniref:Uncharacterized protein n=1 Tax=Fagus sylvatica TaxID=28930 RepID=A0A2N9FF46_FAGSY